MSRYVGRMLRVGDAGIWMTPRLRHQALKAQKRGEAFITTTADENAELCECCGAEKSYAISVDEVITATDPVPADQAANN